jgi:ParB-like chromosome segregation protein Spo0J
MENILRLDRHALIPRFAALRLRDSGKLGRLVDSIRQQGQLMPVVAVPADGEERHWVLIDGYRRLEALGRVGEDLIWVDVWDRPVDEALLLSLARGPERCWEAIEVAALIHELCQRHSQREIALALGRDVSWVNRRLTRFKVLPEVLLEPIRQGRGSVRAATGILAPLARANPTHARTLLEQLEHHGLSTREHTRVYRHYQQATNTARERLVQNPTLFLQALNTRAQQAEDQQLAEGPEGRWYHDLAVSTKILERLRRQLPALFSAQGPAERASLLQAFEQTKGSFQRLAQALEEVRAHD